MKNPAAFRKKGETIAAYNSKGNILIAAEFIRTCSAENKIQIAGFQRGSGLIYAKTVEIQRVFMADNGNVSFFIRKIVGNNLQIKMKTCVMIVA